MNRPSFRQIAAVFLRYGNSTFGGGSSTVAVLQTELMDRQRWVDRETFTLTFGLARLTPGTNLLSFGAGVGWLLRGWGGALSALLAGSIPCSLIALLIRGDHTKRQKLYVSVHGSRSDQSPANLPEM